MDELMINSKQYSVYQVSAILYKDSDTVQVRNLGLLGKVAVDTLSRSILKKGYFWTDMVNSDDNYHNISFLPSHKHAKYSAIVVEYRLLGVLSKMNYERASKILDLEQEG